MLRPVERSITVSAPQRIAQTSFSTSSAAPDVHRGVADIGVDLDQEVAADDHRLELGVVDVGRDDGAAAGDLGAHELRASRMPGSRRRSSRRRRCRSSASASACGAAQVLAVGDVDHLLGDDPGAGELVLRHGLAGLALQHRPLRRALRHQPVRRHVAVVLRAAPRAARRRHEAAPLDPGRPDRAAARPRGRSPARSRCTGRTCRTAGPAPRARTGRARSPGTGRRCRAGRPGSIDLARPGDGPRGDGTRLLLIGHAAPPVMGRRREGRRARTRPYAGMTRIRFHRVIAPPSPA